MEMRNENYDVCVIGGGMAGVCAAIASARGGAKTVLVQERPVLGGNASSEVRMWICGAHGRNNKETGILEEIQLENCYRNPFANYSIWDSVLYEKVCFCPNLTLHLNASCCDAVCENGRIESIRAWQLTTQTWLTIGANIFIDCSGDSILAPLSGAETRWGRESCEEFDEDIEPPRADRKTMGNTLLLQIQKVETAQPYTPPVWAYRFDDPQHFESRIGASGMGHNYWWLELGGLQDTIADAETIRHELTCVAFGIWDYFKNRAPAKLRAQYEEWDLAWVGALPGKRENRRYVGPHILTQNDVRAGGQLEDIVAYGGWSMDDHHPGGLLYPGKPTIFHKAPSPYGIPYRTLHSVNVKNLMCAGRNISVTHAALSSIRVMGTTAIIGQAAGTAAALCIKHDCLPRAAPVAELQRRLMDADCWLPGLTRAASDWMREARLPAEAEVLRDGRERADGENPHAWEQALGKPILLEWPAKRTIGSLRIVLDSNLNRGKQMTYRYEPGKVVCPMPSQLLRRFTIERRLSDGKWETVWSTGENRKRLVNAAVNCETDALRLVPDASWGEKVARVFSLDVAPDDRFRDFSAPAGRAWSEVVASVPPEDLADASFDPIPRKKTTPVAA